MKDSVSVVGLGYVGLPLAVAAAKSGYKVTGIDLDEIKVSEINKGISQIEDIAPHNSPITYSYTSTEFDKIDINGDGVLDMISTSVLDGKVAWYRGTGRGNFASQQIIHRNQTGANDNLQ